MRRIILFVLLSFSLLLVIVHAENLQINIEPSDIWVGDSVTINCWYIDINTTPAVPSAYVEKLNQHTLWTKTDFSKTDDTHFVTTFTPPSTLLGSYQVVCSNGMINSSSATFKMSKLTFSITDYPKIAYLNDELVIHARLMKTSDAEESVSNNVNFDVRLNNKDVEIDNDATYCLGDQWIITTKELSTSNFNPGTYTLTVNATYMGESSYSSKSIEVKNSVEFGLINVDKTEVLPNDNISITIKALNKGNPIPLQNLQLKAQVGSQQCSIIDTTQVGNNLNVIVSAPSLSPGTYNMSVKITYNDYIWSSDPITIDYGVPISVNMKDSDDKAVNAQFRFLVNGVERRKFITDSGGSFSGYIPPSTYDIEIKFPNSQLNLYGVLINNFDNPIKFDSPTTDANIAGVGVANIYIFEVAISYSNAYLELKYDSSKILNEDGLAIYKCENWNFGRKTCSSDWVSLTADIDKIRDLIKINTSSLSAFLIGYKKNMVLNFNTDKDEYYLSDILKISGIVEDEDNKPIPNAQITAKILNTEISTSGKTDNGGVFAFEIQGPDQEGEYSIFLTADKSPFTSVNSSKMLKVSRSSQLSILVPDSFQIRKGENSSMWFSLVNTGQTDFSSLVIKITDIPEEYYKPPEEISELKAGEEKKISIDFKIPEKADIAGNTGKIKVIYDNKELEESFILTILSNDKINGSANQTESGFKFPSLTLPTGKIVLPSMNNEIVLLGISSIIIFSFTVLLKKKRISKDFERNDVKNLLLDIKREVGRSSLIPRTKKSEKVRERMISFRKALKKRKTK